MSDLQIGLIALGVLFILLVLGFNWWQDRRARRRMEDHFPTAEHDPLLGQAQAQRAPLAPVQKAQAGPRREPGMGSDGAPLVDAEPAGVGATTGALADDAEEADPAVEAVIEVVFGQPVRGADLMLYMQNLRQVGRKSMRIFAETDGTSPKYVSDVDP